MTQKHKRNERFQAWSFALIIIHFVLYLKDLITGEDFFMCTLGYAIVYFLISTLEFDGDEELIKKE